MSASTTTAAPQFFIIPTSGQPQTFKVTLVSATYEFTLQYANAGVGAWILTISDDQGNQLVSFSLVAGIDLLEQYAYLGIGGALFVLNTSDPDDQPTFDNLGTDCQLYFAPYLAST